MNILNEELSITEAGEVWLTANNEVNRTFLEIGMFLESVWENLRDLGQFVDGTCIDEATRRYAESSLQGFLQGEW